MKEFFESQVPYEKKESKEKPQRVILEIGAGGSISPYLNDENIEHYKNAHLIRTDIFTGNEVTDKKSVRGGFGRSGALNQARENDKRRIENQGGTFEGKIDYRSCDAKNMPFADETADEIYLANVFSAPGFYLQDRDAILLELERVLKKGGELIFAETYTPQIPLNDIYRDSDRKSFKNALDKYVNELSSISGLSVKTVEFPRFSKKADEDRNKGRNCEKFLSRYPYGKRMFGNDFVPLPTAPNPDYKYIIVFTKE